MRAWLQGLGNSVEALSFLLRLEALREGASFPWKQPSREIAGEVRIRPYSAAALGIAVASVVIDTPSPNTEDDIAYYFSALAELMCQGDVVQWQASSDRVDQAVALEERAELGKAGVAI